MKNLYHRLLQLIAGAPRQKLARHVRYLKIENQILRRTLPRRVPVTAKDRNRLIRFGAKLVNVLSELTTIVHPDTLRRSIRELNKAARKQPVPMGWPRTRGQIRELVL